VGACSGDADRRGAEAPAEGEDAVTVDADQCHSIAILACRFQCPAEFGAADQQQCAEREQTDDAGGKLRHWYEHAVEVDGAVGEQGAADALEVAAERELREAAQQDGKTEGDKDLHHAAVEPHRQRTGHQQVVDRHTQREQCQRDRDQQQQRIESGRQPDDEGGVHGEHQQLAMREVHHIHQAEDQAQPGGDQRIDQPHQQAADGDLEKDGEGHEEYSDDPHPLTFRRSTSRPVPPHRTGRSCGICRP
jgi:hypothetical protein